MSLDASAFVAVGFILFVMLMLYLGVHKTIADALDARINLIKGELAEASRLRQEAVDVLEGYKAKALQAQADADAIVAQARLDAAAIGREAEARMVDFVARRTKQAEQKIALAEAQAAADVKAAAADAAARAAELVMLQDMKGDTSKRLLADSLGNLRKALN